MFCATVGSHFRAFHLPVLEWFKRQGWEVHVAARGCGELPFADMTFDIPFERSPYSRNNLLAYRQLKQVIDRNDYQIIHAHTPMGGVITRLAAREARSRGTKVLYTAHGFHFCKGAPWLNWMLYYPIEKLLAGDTDCLITINSEDYELAHKRKFKAAAIEHVHGIGLDTKRFKIYSAQEKIQLRAEAGYNPEDFLMFYAAEFNTNKNHQLLISALALIKEQLPQARLLLAGQGEGQQASRELASRLGVDSMVEFLGYRNDIEKLLPLCDAGVSASLREGLPVNILEAMACGLPIIATVNRGHKELVHPEKNGFLAAPADPTHMAEYMLRLGQSEELRRQMGRRSAEAAGTYELKRVLEELSNIYTPLMENSRGDHDNTNRLYSNL